MGYHTIVVMKSREDVRDILDSIRRLVRALRVYSRRAHAAHGLTAAQLFVLERVAAHQPVSINTLAELTLTHQSSVSVVARRLVDRGFLLQKLAPADRRRKELTITGRGAIALRQAPVSIQDRLIAAASGLAGRDQRALARLLARLTRDAGLQDSKPVLFFENEFRTAPTRHGKSR